MSKKFKKLLSSAVLLIGILIISSCSNKFIRKVDTRDVPINAQDRARKNVEEGRGASISNILKNRGSTNYEFSTSNSMWRATLDILDFLPLTTVDYSGGIVITDWYSGNDPNSYIKITVRFLNNEIQTNSFKIIVHQKNCLTNNNENCQIKEINSKIQEELTRTILSKATELESEKNKKK